LGILSNQKRFLELSYVTTTFALRAKATYRSFSQIALF
jgi:hypothetical protein